MKISVLPVALTGIASNLLRNGKTSHIAFKLPLNKNESTVMSFSFSTTCSVVRRAAASLAYVEEEREKIRLAPSKSDCPHVSIKTLLYDIYRLFHNRCCRPKNEVETNHVLFKNTMKNENPENPSPLGPTLMDLQRLKAVLDGTARTNNASEGWHNRFQVIVGKKHPSLYTFLTELQHEQGDTETLLRQIQLGQAVRKKPDGHFVAVKDRIMNIVMRYDEYVEDDLQLKYIKDLGHYLHL
ncbi:unnamed protein product [Trichogramma brassicae]|uniref:Uncharacterized protein n=1 Tax=Trichogramma brassicae TaxID=86971 RepID=A0A6H5IMT2_9HYME|nr:unnamed protein product [Trichogramma brassicae]